MNNEHLIDYNESPFSKIIADEHYMQNACGIAYKKSSTFLNTPISKKIDIELRTWKKFINKKYIKSLTYDRIGKFCDFSNEEIRNGIAYIDDIEAPNLPFNFNCKGGVRLDAGIVNEGRTRSRMVEYTNKDREVLEIIKNSAKKVIGNKFYPKRRIDKRDQTICLSFPPIFAKHFLKIGIEGNKNNIIIKIPE